jgi:ABC-type polysaccharide/polyol phosphate transport system, ATPase component
MGMSLRGILTVNLSLIVSILVFIILNNPPLESLFNALAALIIFFTIVGFVRRVGHSEEPESSDIKEKDGGEFGGEELEVISIEEDPWADLDKEDIAIKVENVSMMFNLSPDKVDNLKEYVIKLLKRQLFFQEFWALKDISFTVKKGEKLGIVGLNGAGKKYTSQN